MNQTNKQTNNKRKALGAPSNENPTNKQTQIQKAITDKTIEIK